MDDGQLTFADALTRHDDPPTSRAAAARTNGRRSVLAICAALRAIGPACADELCLHLNPERTRWPTWKSAISRASAHGLIAALDDTRSSVLGAPQRIYTLTAAGWGELAERHTSTQPL